MAGEAVNAEGLLAQMETTCPDLVLLGWELPGLAAVGSLSALRRIYPDLYVIALSGRPEARRAALAAGADITMLDNMSFAEMRQAGELIAGRALVEASGGVNLETVADIAATGVDIISVGALTHSIKAADISMLFD